MIGKFSYEKFFLFISLIFGFLYILILPPFQSVDEANHFFRGYELLSGKMTALKTNNFLGDYLPVSLDELASRYSFLIKNNNAKITLTTIIDSGKIKLQKEKTKFTNFQNTALYSPVCYFPQIPGMYAAKKMNLNPLAIFYAGRLSNLLFFTLIIYFSIKITPIYKLPMLILALMPMSLSLGGALTSDVTLIGLNFLWIALILKMIFQKEIIKTFQIILLTILAIILVLCKSYFILVPLVFLLPKSNFQNFKKYLIGLFSVLFFSLIFFLLWQKVISGLYVNLNSSADLTAQMNFIISHPFYYLAVLFKTLIVKTPRIIITMIGVLGWQDTRLDFLTYILYPILVILSVFIENNMDFSLKKWQKIILLLTFMLSVFFIFTTMYLMWSNVGGSIILGINGKYFIPVVIPFLLLFHNCLKSNFIKKNKKNITILIFILIIFMLISSELSLIHRFYGLTPNLYYKV